MSNCVFCNISEESIINDYKHFFIIRRLICQLQSLHSLVINIVSYFECNKNEYEEIPLVLHTQKTELKLTDNSLLGLILE